MNATSPVPDVLLLTMPFGVSIAPSIGLSLLKAILEQAGFSAQISYLNLRFAELIGMPTYRRVTDEGATSDLIGEWVFARALYPEETDDEAAQYVEEVLRKKSANQALNAEGAPAVPECFIAELLAARAQVESFMEECVASVLASGARIVGFSSIFQQNVASLALAKRLKERDPALFIVFGGTNCEGVMGREISRQFPFVDAVVSGEGEVVFPKLVRRVVEGRAIGDLPGVFSREQAKPTVLPVLGQGLETAAIKLGNAPTVGHLDDLPTPDYADFFNQLKQSSVPEYAQVGLLFETSRGCWWGEKHHCTFCGLNGASMAYRSKSAARALAEFSELTTKHPGRSVIVVDNILNMAYFKDFIPALAERNPGVEIFFEVKANLRKEQLRMLHAAGVRKLQPGIESLSDQVLQVMDKGVRALQNIQLLKWCKEFDIWPQWNLIWGFPGEQPEEYARMAELVPLLTHLPPPLATSSIRIDRFSPNFNQAEQRGFKNLRPHEAYRHIYRLPEAALNNLANFFAFEYSAPGAVWPYVEALANEIHKWQQGYRQTTMFWVEKGERLLLWDERPIAQSPFVVLTGQHKFVYQACDQTRTARQVCELWQAHCAAATLTDVRATLDALVARGLMLRQNDVYLALAVPQALGQ